MVPVGIAMLPSTHPQCAFCGSTHACGDPSRQIGRTHQPLSTSRASERNTNFLLTGKQQQQQQRPKTSVAKLATYISDRDHAALQSLYVAMAAQVLATEPQQRNR